MVPYIPVSYVYDQVAKDKLTLIGTLFFKGFPWLKQDSSQFTFLLAAFSHGGDGGGGGGRHWDGNDSYINDRFLDSELNMNLPMLSYINLVRSDSSLLHSQGLCHCSSL